MIFYRYVLNVNSKPQNTGLEPAIEDDDFFESMLSCESSYDEYKIESLNENFQSVFQANKDCLICITGYDDLPEQLELSVAINTKLIDLRDMDDKITLAFLDCSPEYRCEITTEAFKQQIKRSKLLKSSRVLDMLGLNYHCIYGGMDNPFESTEVIYTSALLSKSDCSRRAKQILASRSMTEELGRIYSKENAKWYYGHPVHYLISANDWNAAMEIEGLLVSALYSNYRLMSKRQTIIRSFDFNRVYHDTNCLKQHIKACEGGTVVIELNDRSNASGPHISHFNEFTRLIGEILGELKKDTLFIFIELPGKSAQSAEAINNITGKADIIRITDGTGNLQQAKKYLAELVKKTDYKFKINEVFAYLPSQKTYSLSDICSAYNAWHEDSLKNYVYKAYKKQKTYQVKAADIKSAPYEELQQLVGLNGIKTVIDQIIAAGKVKCARERMGLNTEFSSMHMLFTGTTGTAKTTVARLVTGILKDEDIITTGQFVECGRQDIVGKYVGWTAKTVEEKFQAAAGGVLFIDEAYSLVDDSNSYGTEAINTITQLMENYRDKVIVIFAGYPDKMRDFLAQNEGLRSRIAFHLDFPDYSPDELTDILKLMCEKRQYTMSDEALKSCRSIFGQASRVENFGNGRYVRNVLEQAIMRQSGRIIAESTKNGTELTKDKLCLLEECDFKAVPLGGTVANKIGFSI